MEESPPLAADGAAPDGQARLPWGDEVPAAAVETHTPVSVEAHPPEPVTHFAMPEATFFTAEPPAIAVAVEEEPHRDEAAQYDEIEERAAEAPPVEEVPDDVFVEDAVDDVWSDDDAWAETPPPVDELPVEAADEAPVADEPLVTEPLVTEPVRNGPPAVEEPVDHHAVSEQQAVDDEPGVSVTAPDAGDEMEAALDELLPSADELPPMAETTPYAAWSRPVEDVPHVDDAATSVEPWAAVDDEPVPDVEAEVEPEVEPEHEVDAEPEVEAEVDQHPPVATEALAGEDDTVAADDIPGASEEAPVTTDEQPVASASVMAVSDAPRMVSPSHPETVEQERVVVDDAAPELEWLDPETTDFGLAAESSPPVAPPRDEAVARADTEKAEPPAATAFDWFNPPDITREASPEAATEDAAGEWLTLPELDEQLAAVSESPPPADELPPMVAAPAESAPASEPPAPFEPAAFVAPAIEEAPPEADEPTLLQPIAPIEQIAPAAAAPDLVPAATIEPLAAPAALSERGRSMRRIVMVAAALVMGTLVVRQLNTGVFTSASPTFVGATGGTPSRTRHAPVDQPATAGSTNGSQTAAAGSQTSTTVAGANATTGSTTAGGAPVAGSGGTATTVAGGKTATTAGPAPTTAPKAPPPAPSSTPGYGAAHFACQKFNNAYAARDNGGMTDDQADDVFVNTASQAYGANQVNPQRWGTLYNHALTLQKQLEGTIDSTDQQIEDQIALVYNDCKAAA